MAILNRAALIRPTDCRKLLHPNGVVEHSQGMSDNGAIPLETDPINIPAV